MHKLKSLKAGLLFIVLVCSLFIFINPVSAFSSGFNSPNTVTSGGAGFDWFDGFNAKTQDDLSAFAMDASFIASGNAFDYEVKLIIGGSPTGDNKAKAGAWPTSDSDTYLSYGGNSDLWGCTLSPAVVNSSDFGVALKVYDGVGTVSDYINFTNFSFAIPDDSLISGVEVKIDKFYFAGTISARVDHVMMNISYVNSSGLEEEHFDDDVDGSDPSSDWYVIDDSGGAVDNGDSFDGSQSYYFDDDGDNFNIYFNNISDDDIVVDWWMKKGVSSDDDFFAVNMYNYSLDSLLAMRIDDMVDNSLIYENDIGEQDTGQMYLNNTWMNWVVRLNFSSHKYNFYVHWWTGDDNGDTGILTMNYIMRENITMINDCDSLRFISFIGWNNSYLDNLSIYQGYPIEIVPHADMANGTTDINPDNIILSVNVSDLNFDNGYDYTGSDNNTLYFYMTHSGIFDEEWFMVGKYEPDDFGITCNSTISINASANYTQGLYPLTDYYWFVTDCRFTAPDWFVGCKTNYSYTDKMGFGGTFPSSGLYHTDLDGTGFYCWTFRTEGNSNASVSSSICGDSLNASEWGADYSPCFTFSDLEGDKMDAIIFVYNAETPNPYIYNGHTGGGYDTTYGDQWIPALNDMNNGTVCFDLSDAVLWDNMNYSIYIEIFEDGKNPNIPANTTWCNFSIGTYADLEYYIGVRNLYPANHDENAYEIIGSSMYFDIGSNYDDFPFTMYLASLNRRDYNQTQAIAEIGGKIKAEHWLRYYLGSEASGTGALSDYITLRRSYVVFVGVEDDDFPAVDLEFSSLYDDCKEEQWYKSKTNIIGWSFGETAYNGISWTFHTFPEGEDPWTYDDPHQEDYGDQTLPGKISDVEDELNVGYLGLLGALILIVVFSFMPIIAQYTVFKDRYKKSVPISVQLSFTLFGVILAFEFGFIPLWTIALGFAIVGIAITFKLFTWFKSRSPIDLNTGGKGDV